MKPTILFTSLFLFIGWSTSAMNYTMMIITLILCICLLYFAWKEDVKNKIEDEKINQLRLKNRIKLERYKT